MEEARPLQSRVPVAAVFAGSAYYALAVLSLYLTGGTNGLATIWPACGVFVAALLLTQRSQHPPIIAAVAIASFAANGMAGVGWSDAAMFTIANICEALTIVWLSCLGNKDGQFGSLSDQRCVGKFFVATIVGTVAGSIVAAVLSGNLTEAFLKSWIITTALGTLIVAPLIITVLREIRSGRFPLSRLKLVEANVIFFSLVFLSSGVFGQNNYPLLFLPLIGVLFATYRLGHAGTALGVLCIALSGSWAMSANSGAIQLVGGGAEAGTMFFQFYIFSLLVAAWPLSAMLARLEDMVSRIQRGNDLLGRAERAANVGHWHYNFADKSLYWSDELIRIHGWEEGSSAPPYYKGTIPYHPADRERVEAVLRDAVEQQSAFEYDARIIHADGEIRHINSIGGAEFDKAGTMTGLFGMVRDVTERVEAEMALEAARQSAESEAAVARELSETDQLTGIPNRRKAMIVLDEAIRTAEANKTPLCIAILDVDHFKSINDSFGHAVGDVVLHEVASLCSDALREEDFVGRLGGEEFLIVMPGAAPEIAMLVAERVRIAIALANWTASGLDPITVSIGVAPHEPGADGTWMMQAADAALYRAKDDGRNLLRLAG